MCIRDRYPLYMAYSLYAMKLPGPEDKLPLEQTQALWQETVCLLYTSRCV